MDTYSGLSGSGSTDTPSLPHWGQEAAIFNASFDRISRAARITPYPPSAPILWDTLRFWEAQARRGSYICNQAACFAVTKLQENVDEHLKTLRPWIVTRPLQELLGLPRTCLGTSPL